LHIIVFSFSIWPLYFLVGHCIVVLAIVLSVHLLTGTEDEDKQAKDTTQYLLDTTVRKQIQIT
jgi:hypothetical protein